LGEAGGSQEETRDRPINIASARERNLSGVAARLARGLEKRRAARHAAAEGEGETTMKRQLR